MTNANESTSVAPAVDVVEPVKVRGVTIDAETTRDIDDAIWVESLESCWRVYVSIAHVAAEVPIDSEIDLRAREAVATRYFATGNSPMLPRKLAEDELSLWEGRARKTITVEIDLSTTCEMMATRVYFSRLRSQAKLAYSELPNLLANTEHGLNAPLKALARIAMGLLERRRAAGAMVLYDLNNGWTVTEEGVLKQLEKKDATIGYIIVQELMILANGALARWAIERDLPVLFRNHQARAAAPDRGDLMRQIQEAITTPLANLDALQQRTHLLLERAKYSSSVSGHFGLNLPAYLHFTSPIRRYADLVTHRQVRASLLGEAPPYGREQIEALAAHINDTLEAQRDARSDAEKAKAEDRARAVDPRRYDGLIPKLFERVVKVEARSGEDASPALVEAFAKRLEDGRMPPICVTVAFAEVALPKNLCPEGCLHVFEGRCPEHAPDGRTSRAGWRVIRGSCLRAMARTPELAITVLTMATQTAGWGEPRFDVTRTGGEDHAPEFTAKVTVNPMGSLAQEASAQAVSCNAKRAKQWAALYALAMAAGIKVPDMPRDAEPPPAPKQPARKPFAIDPSKDPVSVLMEMMQARKIAAPVFSYETGGPPHIPTFTCMCSFAGVEERAQGGNKAEAKKDAARKVLRRLEDRR